MLKRQPEVRTRMGIFARSVAEPVPDNVATQMTVATGTRLGPYEIVSQLGAGGMGEVWQARDTRLDRTVAVKILPATLASSAQFRTRFEREARAISQLNHPHICTIHDVGSENGTDYLVMELLEGESLAERIARGPLPLPDVLRYGIQIGEALDRAHRSGIVHRDLKPGNIMITKSGAKLLDFGLARISGGTRSAPDTPTEHMPLTAEGTIIGTFQYMAPEQLAGDEADTRTDIFAFGAVLYEMLTGRRAFQGKTKTSLIGAIVGGAPQRVSEIQPTTPPALEHVIARCLAKEPDDRWQNAHDIAEELRWISEAGSQAGVAVPVMSRRKNREKWLAALAVLLLASTSILGWGLWRQRSRTVPVRRARVVPPPKAQFELDDHHSASVTMSPDGRYLTYAASVFPDPPQLWLHDRQTGESRALGDVHGPFWSPDGRSLGFYGQGRLKRVDVSGGPAVSIAESSNGRGASWSADGTIVFEPHWRDALYKVAATGGTPVPLTKLDESLGETTHRWPWFLPDGRHFLYLAGSHKGGSDSDVNAIYIGSLDSQERTLLLRARSNAIYANGHVLFVREGHLMAQPFDARSRKLTGEPFRLIRDVTIVPGYFRAVFAASADGSLLYATGPSRGKRSLRWFDLSGNEISKVLDADLQNEIRISPDGSRATTLMNDPSDIWIVDLARGTHTRFTSQPMQEYAAVWSPDSSRIAFSHDRNRVAQIVQKPVDGLSGETPVFALPNKDCMPSDWSPDGRNLLVQVFTDDATEPSGDIWVVPMDGSGKPYPFIETEFPEYASAFSPDGRWVAYLSEESGRREVYVVSFPRRDVKKQLTSMGALGVRWVRNGAELRVVTSDLTHLRIAVHGDSFGVPETLGKIDRSLVNGDYSPDGSRILTIYEEPFEPEPMTVITNWPALSRKD
jgi:eukaryotic-like serine/threonine-protein kinase